MTTKRPLNAHATGRMLAFTAAVCTGCPATTTVGDGGASPAPQAPSATPAPTASSSTDELPVVAVIPLRNKGTPLSATTVGELSDYIAVLLTESQRYQTAPLDDVKGVLNEVVKSSFDDCYDESCQIEVGKQLAAQMSLTGSVAKLGNQCVVTLKLFDLVKATSRKAGAAKASCDQDSIVRAAEIALGKITGIKPIADTSTSPRSSPEPRPSATAKWPGVTGCGGQRSCYAAGGLAGTWRCKHRLYSMGIIVSEQGTLKLRTSNGIRSNGCITCDGAVEMKGADWVAVDGKLDDDAATFTWHWCSRATLDECRAMGGKRETATCQRL